VTESNEYSFTVLEQFQEHVHDDFDDTCIQRSVIRLVRDSDATVFTVVVSAKGKGLELSFGEVEGALSAVLSETYESLALNAADLLAADILTGVHGDMPTASGEQNGNED
jgi:hypothetical protein